MKIDLSRFRETFLEEAREHLSEFETGLLELQRGGSDPELLAGLFRAVHSVKGSSGMFGFTDVGTFSHAMESVLSRLRDGTLPVTPDTVELLLRCSDVLGGLVELAERGEPAPPDVEELETELASVAAGDPGRATSSYLVRVPAGQEAALRAASAEAGWELVESHAPAALPGATNRRAEATRFALSQGSMRVATSRVDELVNLAGELAISQSLVEGAAVGVQGPAAGALAAAVQTASRNVRELQERVLAVRMLPLDRLFARLPRLVHDLAATCEKEVELQTSGGDTELDRSVIERLTDPLTHLIRNAIDHGIESPAERRAGGKPERGIVSLSAWHEGGNVMLELADDGAGLDRGAICARATELGLIRPDEPLTDAQAYSLIFEAGLSTAARVTDVSGRGIGADVVRRNIEALNGTVSVSSTPGAGTRFLLTLPLTLALLDTLQLRSGSRRYLVPLLAVSECLRPQPDQLHRLPGGAELVRVRDEPIPLLRLDRLLPGEARVDHDLGVVVVVLHEGFRFGLLVDELLDPTQVVIKSLEANFRRVEGILGATILGDGGVSLILDVAGLTRMARNARTTRVASHPPPAAAGI